MVQKLPSSGYVIGLDVGSKRIGVASASVIARLPQPLDTIEAGKAAPQHIKELISKEQGELLVVGVPRNLQGEETQQSCLIRDFAERLKKAVDVPVVLVDESLSSVRADKLIEQNQFKNFSRDSLAACFILEEFFGIIDTRAGELYEVQG